MRSTRAAGAVAVIFLGFKAFAGVAPPPLEAFARMPNFESLSISPGGHALAWLTPVNDKHMLIVVDLASGSKPKGILSSEGSEFDLWRCAWANDTRILCSLRSIVTRAGFVWPVHRLVGVDADGSNKVVLMKDRQVSDSEYQDQVLDFTPDEPKTVLIQALETDKGVDEFSAAVGNTVASYPSVFELDVDTGRVRRREASHPPIYRFITDAHGHVRIGIGFSDPQLSYYARLDGESEWRRLDRFDVFERGHAALEPVAVGAEANTLYSIGPYEGRDALWSVDLTDRRDPQVLFSHPAVDVGDALFAGNGRLIGVQYETDRPYVYYTDAKAADVMHAVNEALPGKLNTILDTSADEEVYVVQSSSDVDYGSYYLYERPKKALRRIGVAYPELDPATLGEMRSIAYPARDGTSIPGYLTVPRGVRAENLPLIVMPHGGPISRDRWRFFFLRAFLASRGYAVLQMNFRGSSGYGGDWFYAAHQDWGGLTYNDIADGARWAVKQGIADPKRLGIVGWSFGGYAALMGAVRDSDLFRCSVSIAGVSDLMVLERFTDKAVLRQIGTDWEKLKQDSPRRHADSVRIPILMIHGDHDYQADVEQSNLMARALREANKPFQLVLLDDATHQMDRQSDRLRLLAETEKFLAKNLGPGVSAPSP
jgi:dipeptidyl aminopeptidase/acylaminoacyl peptidase